MKKVSSKLAFALIIGLLIVLIGNTLMLFKNSKNTVESTIANFGITIADNISTKFDTKAYERFLENPVESDTYWNLREELNDFREKIGALYVYTIKIDEKQNAFIMIDGQVKGSEQASELGEASSAVKYKDVEKVLNGEGSSAPIIHDPEYGDYLSAYVPIKLNNKVIGILGVDIAAENVDEISSEVFRSDLPFMVITNGILIFLIIILLAWNIRRKLKPLETISIAAEKMANGDLLNAQEQITKVKVNGEDEVKQVTQSFQHMTQNNIDMINDIKQSSNLLLNSTNEINQKMKIINQANDEIIGNIQEVAISTETQLERSEETVKAIEEMSIGIQRIAEAATDVSEKSSNMEKHVKDGFDEIQLIINRINNMKDTVTESSKVIEELGEQANEIGMIVGLISGVAEQTNLLALNAAIEAARAGEHGKGFAVVSQEVRKLAEESSKSAKLIEDRLNHFKFTIEKAVMNMHEGTKKVEEGALAVNHTQEKFKSILHDVELVTDEIQDVSAITEEMSAGSEEISASIAEFASLTKETADSTKNVAASTDRQLESMDTISELTSTLNELSLKLEQSVKRFNV
ncbi:methyl-accepting chemotaxis protein [Ferdinandcohnia quinoae]|uniref:Methyl-accepting chemotaxis protein n=1 Tax=Fredinandcohnia quinoae TaxID=2918902 RepID=A0AAW5E1A5_9BACI|nr:HAMP domain-containing methyl-accepting chemotaxis protein [Fredinandcohnia sp. SECRCQ15]MCH1626393.1 methyl-accepting chemotaxis protein [Fredinandcohnia sp. SECRCQ15]